jgi:hypothetical protein
MEDFPPGPPNAFIAEELRIREAGALRHQLLARELALIYRHLASTHSWNALAHQATLRKAR